MLTFSIMLDDCLRAPRRQDLGYRLGQGSFVTPFPHSAIATGLIVAERRWLILAYETGGEAPPIIGEITSPGGEPPILSEAVYESAFRNIVSYSNEFFAIECTHDAGAAHIRLLSGSNGTCPIYVSGEASKLIGSWDILSLVTGLSSKRFDEQFLIHAAHRAVYSTRTPYHGVAMMPPYSVVYWDGGAPIISASEPDPDEETAELADFDEARLRFSTLIDDVWSTRNLKPKATAVELSGGYDSSTVALSFARHCGHGANHLSILVPNPGLRESQGSRIAAVNSTCRARSISVSMRDHLPRYSKLARFQSLYYQSESYYSAFHRIWTGATKAGCDVVLSGHGGDELFPTFQGEAVESDRLRDRTSPGPDVVERRFLNCLTRSARELADAPLWGGARVPASRISALAAMARHTPLVMQEGLWPVYPLSNMQLVQFCRALPFELRFEKAMLLSFIEGSIQDGANFRDYEKENFLDGDIAGLLEEEDAIKSLAREMAVYDLDIVLPQQFQKDVGHFYDHRSLDHLHHICSILHMEAFLRESAGA